MSSSFTHQALANKQLCVQSLPPSIMPFPFVPPEIVGEIALHLRSPLTSDTREAIEAGQALSLVCRSWRSIGQELRWKDLRIDVTSLPSLVAHFDLYPHLPRLVRSLKQSGINQIDHESELVEGRFDMLAKLLSSLHELQALNLQPDQSAFEPLFQAAASLTQLELFKVVATQPFTWSNSINATFAQGFPSLRQLCLDTRSEIIVDEARVNLPLSVRRLKEIESLFLSSLSSNVAHLAERIFVTIDPSTLRIGFFCGPSDFSALPEWLTRCTNLVSLIVTGNRRFLDSTFPTLLSSLSKSKTLRTLGLGALDVEASYPSPITLNTVFALVPTSLLIFSALQLKFADSNDFQYQPLSTSSNKTSTCIVRAMTATSAGDRCVEFWKESEAEAEKSKGCCHVLDYATWEEYAAMYVYSQLLTCSTKLIDSHLRTEFVKLFDQSLYIAVFPSSPPRLSISTHSISCTISIPYLNLVYFLSSDNFSISAILPLTFLSVLSTHFRFTPSTAFRLPPTSIQRLDPIISPEAGTRGNLRKS